MGNCCSTRNTGGGGHRENPSFSPGGHHSSAKPKGGRPVPGGGQRVTKPQHSSFSIKASGPPWLFGEITREKAEELLIPYAPTYNGVFLVRRSAKNKNMFALSLTWDGEIKHFLARRGPDGSFIFNKTPTPAKTLPDLVQHLHLSQPEWRKPLSAHIDVATDKAIAPIPSTARRDVQERSIGESSRRKTQSQNASGGGGRNQKKSSSVQGSASTQKKVPEKVVSDKIGGKSGIDWAALDRAAKEENTINRGSSGHHTVRKSPEQQDHSKITKGGRPVPSGGKGVTKSQHSSSSIKASGPPWLFGEITRKKAEELLIPYAPEYNGVFLVRRKAQNNNTFALSLTWDGEIKHLLARSGSDGSFILNMKPTPCKTLPDLVQHLRLSRLSQPVWRMPLSAHIDVGTKKAITPISSTARRDVQERIGGGDKSVWIPVIRADAANGSDAGFDDFYEDPRAWEPPQKEQKSVIPDEEAFVPDEEAFDGFQEPPDMTSIGITLAGVKGLKDAVQRYNRDNPRSPIKKTADISTKIVKPATSKLPRGKQAYVFLNDSEHRGTPECFVSHTWQADALGLLDAVIKHGDTVVATGGSPPVYYLDLASVDQHQIDQALGNTAMPFDTLSEGFVGQITACREVLVVASPFYDPLVIHRAWCLFEAVIAFLDGVPIIVVSPPTEQTELRNRIYEREDGFEILIEVMTTIDSSRAEATVAEDLRNIQKVIESEVEGGCVAVDGIYKTMIRQWVLSLLDTLLGGFKAGSAEAGLFANKCGDIMRGVAEYTKAIEYHEKALAIRLDVHGDKHPDVATTYNNLGSVYMEQHEYTKAVEFYEKALAVFLEHDHKHVGVADAYSCLGVVYAEQGEYSKAIKFLEKALAICLELHGHTHASVAKIYSNLGRVYFHQRVYTMAIKHYEKGLAIDLEVHGHKHPETATDYYHIGLVYYNQDEYSKAIEFYEKALAIELAVHGHKHPYLGYTYSNIGSVYAEQGENSKTIEYYEKALAIEIEVHGHNHPDVAPIYNAIGIAHNNEGEYSKAIDLYLLALAILVETHGPKHPDIVSSYRNIGSAYNNQDEYSKAIEFYEKAVAVELELYGPKHLDVAASYNTLGSLHFNNDDYSQAVEYYEKALAIRVEVLGDEHQDTKKVAENLANAKANL